MSQAPIISIEGVIGVGKSTLCEKLQKKGYWVSDEPVKEWLETKDENGKNILDYLYTDIIKFGFPMQIFAFISKSKMLMETLAKSEDKKPIFVERCIYTDKECFAKNLRNSGLMSDIEWIIYEKCFEYITSTFSPKVPEPDAYIYMRTSDIDCVMDRIKKRGRESEASIKADYITSLHKSHDEWLYVGESEPESEPESEGKNDEEEKKRKEKKPVLIIDVSKDEMKDDNLWEDIIEKIEIWSETIRK
jgi:deoxyadenosine/deoxycytidine kinase